MSLAALLHEVERLHIILTLNSHGGIHVTPSSALTRDLRDRVRWHKPQLIAYLQGQADTLKDAKVQSKDRPITPQDQNSGSSISSADDIARLDHERNERDRLTRR